MTFPHRLRWLWLTLVVVLLDRATKAWIESRPAEFFQDPAIPRVFKFVYSRNPGIGFGFLAGLSSPALRILLVCGSFIVIAVLAWMLVASKTGGAPMAAGLALLLGGATGNLTDRLLHGAVTDFLEVRLRFLHLPLFDPWPAFNVADSAIAIGALLILLEVLFPLAFRPSKS
ncbi:MAG TPA: signal peptidase II [Candidatus Udaeobacter sp.]|nr:signal peptidase II [Candidatus Udaeobacter sp.]